MVLHYNGNSSSFRNITLYNSLIFAPLLSTTKVSSPAALKA